MCYNKHMPKYYVKYKNKSLITDQSDPEEAAYCLILILGPQWICSHSDYIHVDERGFRTEEAENKFEFTSLLEKVYRKRYPE